MSYENGVITGKGFNYGGSRIRAEATGYGVTYFVREMLKDIGETIVDEKSCSFRLWKCCLGSL